MQETEYQNAFKDEYLEHFGIKGMKWGIRRTPEQLGHKKKQRTPEQIAKAEKRKETAKKALYTAAKVGARVGLAYAGGLAVTSLATSPATKAAVAAGTNAITKLFNISEGPAYYNIKSISAQKIEQQLQGKARIDSQGRIWYTNLKSEAAQRLEQDLRRFAK